MQSVYFITETIINLILMFGLSSILAGEGGQSIPAL